GHSQLKTGHPVRSAIHKQLNGRLVLRWVTTWESLLLYVLNFDLVFVSLQPFRVAAISTCLLDMLLGNKGMKIWRSFLQKLELVLTTLGIIDHQPLKTPDKRH
ncbi:hypothetical protein KCU73_g10347, partial [Aureobasidium melanogenum]